MNPAQDGRNRVLVKKQECGMREC